MNWKKEEDKQEDLTKEKSKLSVNVPNIDEEEANPSSSGNEAPEVPPVFTGFQKNLKE